MERYLLFDSACSQCSQFAHTIEEACGGWCTVRSLREPAMQEFLGEANPQWKWEPTLIEIQGTSVKSFTGITLRMHFLRELGPNRTWRLLQSISQTFLSSSHVSSGRRHLLKRSGAILAALALTAGIGALEPVHAQGKAEDPSTPFSMSPLDVDDSLIQQLQHMDVVKTASRFIGTPDWTTVFKVTRGASSTAVYVITYQSKTSQDVVKATFLCVASTSKAVVAQLLHTDEQMLRFAWLTPDLHYLGMTTTSKDGKVEATTDNPHHLGVEGTATPDFSWSCFISCLTRAHVPQWCIDICDACGILIFVACPACAGCVGGSYAYCVATC